jgi:hypothetical protein
MRSVRTASLPPSVRQPALAAPEPLDDGDAIETAPVREVAPARRGEPDGSLAHETPQTVGLEDGADADSLENLVAQFLAEEGGNTPTADGATQAAMAAGEPEGRADMEAPPDEPVRGGTSATLRSRLGLPPERVEPVASAPAAAAEAPPDPLPRETSAVSAARGAAPASYTRSARASEASPHGKHEEPPPAPRRTPAPGSAAPKRASASQDDAAFGEEDLLERLVAEFLAKEGADLDGELSPEAIQAIEGELAPPVDDDAAAPETHSQARTVRDRGASGTTLPAVRGAGLPARSRLLERAPELRRGHARLLGAGAAKPRIALDAPPPAAASDSTQDTQPETSPAPCDEAGANSAPDAPQADPPHAPEPHDVRLTVPFMFGLPLG